MGLQIEYVPIESIKPYKGNAKLHPQEQIEQIKRSIELMGFDDPIAIWQNGEIIEGHGRYIAAKQLGMKEVPIIRLESLTDEQRRAYALIHNKLTMNSGFDMDILRVELEQIESFEMGEFDFALEIDDAMENGGFSEEELSDLFADSPHTEKQPKTMKCPHCGEIIEL